MTYTIGIDVGGTFTDIVVSTPGHEPIIAKAATTPDDQSTGVLDGIAWALLGDDGHSRDCHQGDEPDQPDRSLPPPECADGSPRGPQECALIEPAASPASFRIVWHVPLSPSLNAAPPLSEASEGLIIGANRLPHR